MKLFSALLFSLLMVFAVSTFGQISAANVETGAYTPGSTIAATFSISPSTCIAIGNKFNLELSDASGNFGSTPNIIGSYTGFYSTFVNGIIPLGTPAGTGYKVRIKSTNPAQNGTPSSAFEIRAGTSVQAKITSELLNASNTEVFGLCSGTENYKFYLQNESTVSSTVTAIITNELTSGTSANITFDSNLKEFTASLAHYTIFTKAVMPDGTLATKAYFIVNNQTITAFSTVGNNVVCLPGGALSFLIDVTGSTGIQNNFPGNTYKIDWGDGSSNNLTFCDLKTGIVQHSYTTSSCGQTYKSGATSIYNAFGINVQLWSPFCGNLGTPVSTTAKVVNVTQNSFTGPSVACKGTSVAFNNNSVLGQNPTNTSATCLPDDAKFKWFVDGVIQAANVSKSYVFNFTFTTNGTHKVRLESTGSTGCPTVFFEQTICVQNPPQPSFTLPTNLTCTGTAITPTNTSVIDNTCGNNITYSWTVSPATGFAYTGGTNANSETPQFIFNTAGTYTIQLGAKNAACSTVNTSTQTIVVNATPTVSLSPNVELCNIGTFKFDGTAGITKTSFTGTTIDATDTYTWSVNGGNYTFTAGSTANTKFPSIQFLEFKPYTISVTHKNNCGTETKSQVITFTPAPIVNAGADVAICYNDPSVTLNANITGSVTGFAWVGGSGTFSPNRNTLNAVYSPTLTEKNSGSVELTLRATSTLPAPCNVIEDKIIITIKPKITINSATTKQICNGSALNYTPTSPITGTTYTWTATGSTSAGGFNPSGSGASITDVLTNSDASNNATVTYIITPTTDGCDGDNFTLTVTINPTPVLTATAVSATICSGNNVVINLSSSVVGTKYSWTTVAVSGVIGNTSNATATTTSTISQLLTNNDNVAAIVNYIITPISLNGCSGTPVNVAVMVEPKPTIANAGPNESICNSTSYTLKGNQPTVGTGKWTEVSTNGGISFDDDTKFNAVVSGLQAGKVYIFKWKISAAASCTPSESNVTITVNPLSVGGTTAGASTVCAGTNTGSIALSGQVGNIIRWESSINGTTWSNIASTASTINYANLSVSTRYRAVVQSGVCAIDYSSETVITVKQPVTAANAGADQTLCNATSATLAGNNPLVGTGTWTLISGQAGVSFTDANLFNTPVSGLVPGQSYTFRWIIDGQSPCPPSSDDVVIKVDPLSVGGTTAGASTVCAGTNTGSIVLSGQVGNIIRWESSTNGTTWSNIASTASTINYANLSVSTRYRAVVQSGVCAIDYSSETVITVKQPVTAANAGADQTLCNATSATLAGNNPLVGTGTWTLTSGQAGVSFTDANLFNTAVGGLLPGQSYTFRWIIDGQSPCPPSSDDVVIKVDPLSVGGTTAGTATVCAGTNTGSIALSGQVGNIIRWESSTNGTTWSNIASTASTINYANLSFSTRYRAVVQSGVCAIDYSSETVITVKQPVTAANAGADQTLCNATSATLAGNNPLVGTGTWTLISGQAGVSFTDANLFNTPVSGLVPGQSYTFRWSIDGQSPCTPSSDDVVIENLEAITNNLLAASFAVACTNQTITISGGLPTGGNNSYAYIWQSSANSGITWNTITGQTSKDLTFTVTNSLAYRRIINSGPCSSISNIINITALPTLTNNSIGSAHTICLTTNASPLTGSQPNGGDGSNYSYVWQKSIDNGANWTTITAANTKDYSPGAITETTLYRRVVSSGPCAGTLQSISNTIKITVNLNAKADFTFTNDTGCIPFTINSSNVKAIPYPSQNASYTWYANGVLLGTGINFPGYTISTNNSSVVIKLVTTSSLGCITDEKTHTFSTRADNAASFTQSTNSGCGPLNVTFTNTSTSLTGATFNWDFGNGVTSALANPGAIVFNADPTGEDKEYTVTLTLTNPCGNNTFTSKVLVKGTPISTFSPDNTLGCSPFTVKFSNTTLGNHTSYTFDFGDGNTLVTTNKNLITHTYTTTTVQDYTVKMQVTSDCGTSESQYTIRVMPNTIDPQLVVNSNQLSGCAPLTVDFFNNTKGATSYKYTFGDGSIVTSNTLFTEKQTHTFTKAGVYTVELFATNGCSSNSTTKTITVYEQPLAVFKADQTIGCAGLSVKFSNTSLNGVSYLWDFGDGTTSTQVTPTHIYTAKQGLFTVKLTAYNNTGCPQTTTITDYIKIVGAPTANFSISPAAVISIPDHTFKFTNESTNNPQTYQWSFGDGDVSSLKDPTHTYADTGKYLVKLKAYNEQGCVDSTQKYVQIVGIPGYVYVPNSFMPGSNSLTIQKFTAIGAGIKSWRMRIFNKLGQTIWETNKLENGQPTEGWDGTYNGVPQPQGIYFWKIEVSFINGTEWKGMSYGKATPKQTGEINLLR